MSYLTFFSILPLIWWIWRVESRMRWLEEQEYLVRIRHRAEDMKRELELRKMKKEEENDKQ
jgi:hypothetical protein